MTERRDADPGYVVREIRPEEHAAAGEVVAAAYAARAGFSDAYLRHVRSVGRRARSTRIFVAVEPDGTILGCVTYVPGPDNPYAESELEGEAGIRMLGVAPGAQGRGVGRALTEACIAQARADGRRGIALMQAPGYAPAERLYASLGFRHDPARDFTPEPDIHLQGFVLDL